MDRTKVDVKRIIDKYVQTARRQIRIDGVFLFGSFARGEETSDSDIDLVVLSRDFANTSFIKRLELLSHIQGESDETASYAFDLFGYTPAEFQNLDKDSVIMQQAKKEGYFVVPLKK